MNGVCKDRADLPELTELCGGHCLESFTSDAHIVPDRDCQVGIGAVAVLHGEGSLLLLCLLHHVNELAYLEGNQCTEQLCSVMQQWRQKSVF